MEVEEVIRSNENVYDCAVIGIANEEWGQEIRAIVELKDGKDITEEELIEFCRGRLAGFKRFKSFILVDELPRTPIGKILKRELRKQHGS